jgi:hypothetical protein
MGEEGAVYQQKLRVVYLPAEEGPLDEEEENYPPQAEASGVHEFVSQFLYPVVLSETHICDSKIQ